MEPDETPEADERDFDPRAAQAARRRRDLALTTSERLDHVHELCAQLARLRLVSADKRR